MRAITVLIPMLLMVNNAFAQSTSDIKKLKKPIESNQHQWEYNTHANNEVEFIYSNLFIFYKKHISSQDASKCGFHPSCSAYALEAINKEGTIIGVINFFDRFARCNSFSPEQYSQHGNTELKTDEVRNIKYQTSHE